MKLVNKILLLSIVLFSLSFFNVEAASNIDGKSFHVKMNVSDDGVVRVEETLDVFFNGYNQGIYVIIPQTYRMNLGNGMKNYIFPVKNFQILSDDEVSVNSSSEGIQAIIGTEGDYITGAKQYRYSYEIHMQDVNLKDKSGTPFDLMYLNIVSRNGWEFGFERVQFSIVLPQQITEDVNLYATTANLPVKHSIRGNMITGSYDNLPVGEGLSVEIAFRDGYFNYPSNDFTIVPAVGILIISILSIILYPKLGKEYPVIETVEFKGPKDISSAEAGYVFRGHNNSQDIISLIVYWASKGYLTLIELDENGDDIQINKMKELHSDNEAENAIFKQLFIKGDSTSTKELTNKFAPTIQYGITHIGDRFRKSNLNHVFNGTSSFYKGFAGVMMVVFSGLLGGSLGYRLIPMASYFMIGGAIGLFVGIAAVVLSIFTFSKDGISTRNRSIVPGIVFAIIMIFASYFIYNQFFINDINGIVFFLSVGIIVIALAAIANMGKRTQYGVKKYGEILGLKRFIETAEVERIKMFAEETPSLFYDLLPYTYILGLTDVWMKKFETIKIEQPDWYQSSTPGNLYRDIYIMNALNRSMTRLNSSMTSVPQPSVQTGGSRFGGGGGFGSSGGGGFGGGGFGGSGGGGW